MNQLENTLTSLEVAEMVGKNHKEVLRDIRKIIEQSGQRKVALTYFQEDSYEEVERRGGFKFNIRLRNMQTRQIEKGYSKSAVKKLNKLDVIEADKKATQIYIQVVKEFAIKYQVELA